MFLNIIATEITERTEKILAVLTSVRSVVK